MRSQHTYPNKFSHSPSSLDAARFPAASRAIVAPTAQAGTISIGDKTELALCTFVIRNHDAFWRTKPPRLFDQCTHPASRHLG
jgi:hypothetical protein